MAADGLFTMTVSEAWITRAREIGISGDVFPYLYPPIWAWLLAPVTKIISFDAFAQVMLGINAAALFGMAGLAARLAGQERQSPLAWLLIMLLGFYLTRAGQVALLQGQPQILTAFLTLYGLDRAANGKPVAGGVGLGVAIALKLAPLPIALIWLLTGQRRAGVVAFATAGALGLASIGLAGWPVHEVFLENLSTVAGTVMGSSHNFSIETLVARQFWSDQLLRVPPLEPGLSSWSIMAKPEALTVATRLAMLAVLAGSVVALRRVEDKADRALVWAATLTLLALLGPLGWSYYYLAPMAFLPLLARRFPVLGIALLAAFFVLLFKRPVGFDRQAAGTLLMVALSAGFILAAWARRREWVLRPGLQEI